MKTILFRLKEFFVQISDKHQTATNAPQKKTQKDRNNHPIIDILKDIFKPSPGKYNWSDVTGVLAGIIGLAAYCAISPALAKYRGTQVLLWAARIAIGVMILILVWELLCIAVSVNWENMKKLLHILLTRRNLWLLLIISCGLFLLFIFFNPPVKIGYYADITEIYGVPAGVGEIPKAELKNRDSYWKIVDYRWFKRIVLTYVDPYEQLEVMRENSSAYSMTLFPAPARIVCKYSIDQEEYRVKLDETTFAAAAEAGILRAPVSLSYFSSSGKLVLRLEQNGFGRAKITAYSPDEMPQLLGSTLLRIPDGQSAGNEMTSLQIETTYRSDGLPASRQISPYVYNQYGVNGERYTYNGEGQLSALCYLDIDGEPVCNKLGIMSISLSYYDDGGPLRSIRYFSDQNNIEKTEGFYGVFCEKFKYNDLGNLTDRWELDRSESWCYDKDGVYHYYYHYDDENEKGRLTHEEFFDRENAPVESDRFHTSAISYDLSRENGNDILSICYGVTSVTVEGEPTPVPPPAPNDLIQLINPLEAFASKWTESTEADQYLPVLSQTNVQLPALSEGRAVASTEVQNALIAEDAPVRSYATLHYIISSQNRQVSAIHYYDREGRPTESEEGYAEKRLHYDTQAHLILEAYYDAAQEPCLTVDGYASVERTYDKDGRIETITYRDLDGKPTIVPEKGYASLRYSYSLLGQREIIRTSYCDAQGEIIQPSSLGYAIVEHTYNESGLLIQEAYFNVEDAPAYRLDYRVAAIIYEYSDSGDLIHEYYRDAEGMPVNRFDKGYAVIHQTFDRGQVVQRSYEGYVDHKLQPVPDCTTGATVIKYRYQNGKVQRVDYYGPDGEERVLCLDTGYAACEYEYENGRLAAQHFYGTDGTLMLRSDHGYAHRRNKYTELGQLETIRYTDVEDNPIISTYYHCAGFNYGYDDQGNRNYICYIGLDGNPLLRSDLGYAQLEREYRNGEICEEWYKGTDGRPSLCKDGGYAHFKKVFDPNGNCKEDRYYGVDDNLTLRSDQGYAMVKYTYDDDGQLISERFYDTDEETLVISSYYHCAGFDYGYDEHGNRSDISYVGLDEKPLIRSDLGYARVRKTFENGNIIKEEFFDASGAPTPCKDGGNASYTSVYENGNCVESRYYDTEGQLMVMNYGYAFIQNTYDEFGQRLSCRFYDTDEKTPIISSKYHCAGFDYEYDNMGNETRVKYIGPDGKLMPGADLGYAQVEKTYNAMGKLIGEAYFDVNGDPAFYMDQGYTAYEEVYENGLWIATRYYAYGQLTQTKKGYAVLRNEYNDYGQLTLQQYYDTDEETLVVCAEHNCAAIRCGYDERGNTNYYGYLDPDGELMILSDYGYAQVKKSFNDRDELEGEIYLDAAGQPATYKGRGYAAFEQTYENGLLKEKRYLNSDREPIVRTDEGYAIVRYEYDSYGQNISVRYYDISGQKPVINTYYHCAGFEYEYDEQGYKSEYRYIGLDGELLIRSDLGFAQVMLIHHNGKTISESYFDADGNLIPHKERGYTSFEDDYDVSGNFVESRYYDSFGNLTLRKDQGYAVARYVYDDLGHCISTRYYGTDGETPVINTYYHCAGFDYECDTLGNRIKVQYIGLDGGLMTRSDLGYAQSHRTFDEMGRQIGAAYYDVDGNPTVNKEGGYASYKSIYDPNGNWKESRYYDTKGAPTRRNDTGYAVIKNEYDAFNQRIFEYYYNTDGKTLILNKNNNCAVLQLDHDKYGNHTDTRYFDTNNQLISPSDLGFAHVVKVYDNTGQLIGEKYFDVDEQPTESKNGYASYESLYENSLWMQSTYFDVQGNPVVYSDEGYAVIRNTYDDYGRLKTHRFYGEDGETPIVSEKYHCIGYNFSYDERGNQDYKWYMEPDETIAVHSGTNLLNYLIYDDYYHIVWDAYYIFEDDEPLLVPRKDLGYAAIQNVYEGDLWVKTSYLDENEQPIINEDTGYAVMTREFNDLGQLKKVSYYDKEENLTECKTGYAVVEYEYDESGNEINWIYTNALGEPVKWWLQ